MVIGYKQFIEEGTQKVNKLIKGWSYLLVISKMEGRTIMEYHFMRNKPGWGGSREC